VLVWLEIVLLGRALVVWEREAVVDQAGVGVGADVEAEDSAAEGEEVAVEVEEEDVGAAAEEGDVEEVVVVDFLFCYELGGYMIPRPLVRFLSIDSTPNDDVL